MPTAAAPCPLVMLTAPATYPLGYAYTAAAPYPLGYAYTAAAPYPLGYVYTAAPYHSGYRAAASSKHIA